MGIKLHQKSQSFNDTLHAFWSVKYFPYDQFLENLGYSYTVPFIHDYNVRSKH